MISSDDVRVGLFMEEISVARANTIGKCKSSCDDGFIIDGDSISECLCMRRFRSRLERIIAGIPKLYWNTLDNKSADKTFYLNKKRAFRLIKGLLNGKYSFFFSGDNGTGKTFLACILMKRVIARKKKPFYITMRNLFQLLRDCFDDEEKKKFVDEIMNVDLLVIDEVGKIKTTDYVLFEFESLLRERITSKKSLILVTNMEPSELAATYGKSVTSLLAGTFKEFHFKGKDMRCS